VISSSTVLSCGLQSAQNTGVSAEVHTGKEVGPGWRRGEYPSEKIKKIVGTCNFITYFE
jgi:hypothetical protein